ncbi:hypothetical protein OROHE_012566 [Orobanche hederae]
MEKTQIAHRKPKPNKIVKTLPLFIIASNHSIPASCL